MKQMRPNSQTTYQCQCRAWLHALLFAVLVLWLSPVMAITTGHDEQSKGDINSAALARLYDDASESIWLQHQQLTTQAYDALEFIASAGKHGLNPDDYHLELLRLLQSSNNEAETRLLDLMLSDGLLKLIQDISVGRLDPSVVDPKWSIPRGDFDAVSFLRQALNSKHFRARLDSLVPSSDSYRQIRAAIDRYQGYVDRGGWKRIPATRALKPGDSHANIPAIRDRLNAEGYHAASESRLLNDVYDDNLVEAVKAFQRNHSINVDGIIGGETLRTMNVSAGERLKQIKLTLERLRWLPDDLGDRYILINLANYRLTAVENEEAKLDMRVIVGKTDRSTPSLSSQITDIVQNPRWYIPNKLARLDLLPKQQRNPNYFNRMNIRVYQKVEGEKVEINPHSVDWSMLNENYFPYTLVQDAGEKNALGKLKFIMPNPWSIYLHDTPSKSLFKKEVRNFSAGCVRVEDPDALASFTLADNNMQSLVKSDDPLPSTRIKLEQPLSVYLVYTTVWLDGDRLMFSPDRYRRDELMARYI